ncbi:7-cyano-7-deazaguanine synthase [Microbacterium sp. RURRCA19A]|uniref:7-cyano-7-deazaguanine synthase n=1 Tax=Microbacterium sp. RURRCA19A TaxID=1907391 RepID=UPI000953FAF9|nr:7-cyano-7-deazaguanine synthase [Microbacterium sp. RURRCA19A]SIS10863.1 7-cyano-7-deazaguanine synthase [Microbacterium sp. RURRCA19A]
MSSIRREVLLLSGGLDSVALAYEIRPAYTLFINYGQRASVAEERSARAVANALGLEFHSLVVDLSATSGGLMSTESLSIDNAPSVEWWPFRNQMLISLAAAWACRNTGALSGAESVSLLIGCVQGDGDRHIDGSEQFVDQISRLLQLQEGAMTVVAPAIHRSSEQLVVDSTIPDALLAYSHSCHRASLPCMECPGCYKRERVLVSLGRLQ